MSEKHKFKNRFDFLEQISEQKDVFEEEQRKKLEEEQGKQTPPVQDPADQTANTADNTDGVKNDPQDQKKPEDDELDFDHIKSKKLKVKIDGQEKETTIEDVIRSYQKNGAADVRLQLAAEKERQLEQERLRFEQERMKLLDIQKELVLNSKQSEQKTDELPEEGVQNFKNFMSNFYGGDEEETAKAFQSLLDKELERREKLRQKDLDQKIATELEQRVKKTVEQVVPQIQLEQQWANAVSDYRTKHPEIFSDPDLQILMKAKVDAVISEAEAKGLVVSPYQALDEAKNRMAKFLPQKSGNEANTATNANPAKNLQVNTNVLAEREKAKQQANQHNITTNAASQVQANKQTQEEGESAEDIINQIRKNRGQRNY